VDTIRLKLFKIGAIVRISARRVWLELSSTYPWKQIYARAFDALRLLTASTATKQLLHTNPRIALRSYATNPASICEVPFYAFAKALAKVIPC